MDFVDVATTTFAAREFTDDPVPDEVLYRIFDTARFAPNGGNRQGWKVIVIRDTDTCLLYTSPSPRDGLLSRMPSSA